MAKKINPAEVVYKDDLTTRFLEAMAYIVSDPSNEINSEEAFGQTIGEYAQNFSKMRKGERAPTHDQIGRACSQYGMSLDYLYFGKGDMFRPDTVVYRTLSQRIAALENRIKRLAE